MSPKLKQVAQAARAPSAVLASTEVERSLRDHALDPCNADRRDAIAILADFYEQHGQPSRAALWREQLLEFDQRPVDRRYEELEELPDLLTRTLPIQPQAFDFRRRQMMWLLCKQGVSARKVGAAFRILAFAPHLSIARVERIVAFEDQRICMHAKYEQLWPTLKATQRLIAAGALPGDRPTSERQGPGVYNVSHETWFDLCDVCDVPPEDWPAEHKRRDPRDDT